MTNKREINNPDDVLLMSEAQIDELIAIMFANDGLSLAQVEWIESQQPNAQSASLYMHLHKAAEILSWLDWDKEDSVMYPQTEYDRIVNDDE